jgi:transposase
MFAATLNKNEVAAILQISSNTLRIWLNSRYYDELKILGYRKTQKKLNPKQINYLIQKIDFQPEPPPTTSHQ